jgi:hypothetical protein
VVIVGLYNVDIDVTPSVRRLRGAARSLLTTERQRAAGGKEEVMIPAPRTKNDVSSCASLLFTPCGPASPVDLDPIRRDGIISAVCGRGPD